MSKLPELKTREVIRAFGKAGFEPIREGKKHTILARPDHTQLLAIPRHTTVARGTLRRLISTAALTTEEFLALL